MRKEARKQIKSENPRLLLFGFLGSILVHFFMLSLAAACWMPDNDPASPRMHNPAEDHLFLELTKMNKLRREVIRERGANKNPRIPELAARAALSDGNSRTSPHRVCVDDPKLQARLKAYKTGVMEIWEGMNPSAPGYAIVVFKTDSRGKLADYYIRDMSGGTDFRIFLLDFLKKVQKTKLIDSGVAVADWFECEFRVRASMAAEK
jgi:hypothetical protein